MGYRDIKNLNHDPKMAEALGNMIVAWARAETQLANVFAYATKIHFNTATVAFYQITTFEARLKVLSSILTTAPNPPHNATEIVAEITKLRRLTEARNQWVHGVWCIDESNTHDTVIFNFRAPDESDHRTKPVKAADIANHVTAVCNRISALNRLVPLYYYPPKPSS